MHSWLQDSIRLGVDAMIAKLTWANAAAVGIALGLFIAYELIVGFNLVEKSKDK